jgi:uncharacterized Zn-binding protein involved in type VI secretion
MPKVARGNEVDSVSTNHLCISTTKTKGKSGNVFVNGTGIHRFGDKNKEHNYKPGDSCVPHQTTISGGSPNVFANTKKVADVGDAYTGGETVSSGSNNVFANGV